MKSSPRRTQATTKRTNAKLRSWRREYRKRERMVANNWRNDAEKEYKLTVREPIFSLMASCLCSSLVA